MYERDDKQRRALSQSYEGDKDIELKKTTSQSAKKIGERKAEELEQQQLLQRVLQKLPSGEYQWKMTSFEQKRNLSGLKTHITWHCLPRKIHASFKLSFSSYFFSHMTAIVEGDLVLQLSEISFELNSEEKVALRQKCEAIVSNNFDKIKARGFGEQYRRQSQFLRTILIQTGEELKKTSEARRKTSPQKIDHKKIKQNSFPNSVPSTLCWNPLDYPYLSQDQYPIGQSSVLQKYIEANRQAQSNIQEEQDQIMQVSQGQKATLYDWKVNEQITLILFHKKSIKIDQYSNSRNSAPQELIQKRDQQIFSSENIDLGTLSRLPPKLRKAYERYFGQSSRPTQSNRHDKLKVHDIQSLSQQDEDDIIFLIQRISSRPTQTSISQITFQNHFTIYPSVLNAPIDAMRYDILSKQLRLQIQQPQVRFGAFLRMFILENDFICGQLEKYFRQQYRIVSRMPHPEICDLGSYCKFDKSKAEMIFMDILKVFLTKNDEVNRVKTSGIHRRRRPIPSRLNIEPVVTDEQKQQFLRSLGPFLIVKDRQMDRFQFKKVKKILAANTRLTSFIQKMNQFVNKFQQGRIPFLKTVVEEFFNFRQDLKNSSIQPNRYFVHTCLKCRKKTYFYTMPTYEQTEFCYRCRISSASQMF